MWIEAFIFVSCIMAGVIFIWSKKEILIIIIYNAYKWAWNNRVNENDQSGQFNWSHSILKLISLICALSPHEKFQLFFFLEALLFYFIEFLSNATGVCVCVWLSTVHTCANRHAPDRMQRDYRPLLRLVWGVCVNVRACLCVCLCMTLKPLQPSSKVA